MGYNNSSSKFLSQVASRIACSKLLNSASVMLKAIVDWRFFFQLIGLLLNLNR